MTSQARIQINMSVKKMEAFEALSSIKDTLIPILWFEEGIDELGDEEILNTQIIKIPQSSGFTLGDEDCM